MKITNIKMPTTPQKNVIRLLAIYLVKIAGRVILIVILF